MTENPIPDIVSGPDALPSTELKQRVLRAAAERSAATRTVHQRQQRWYAIGAAAVALGIFWFMGGVRVTERDPLLWLGSSLGTAVIAFVCARLALSRGRSTLGRSAVALWALGMPGIPAVLAWKTAWSAQFDGAMIEWVTRPGFRCLWLTLAMATPSLLLFVWSLRGTDPRHPALTGFAGGIAIGTTANVLTDLWCPVAYFPHLLLGHALPALCLGLFGAALGNFAIRLRSTT